MTEAQPSSPCWGTTRCPDCGCERLVRDSSTGEVVCQNCGVVVVEGECVHGFAPKQDRGSFALMNRLGSGRLGYVERLKYGEQRFLRLLGREGVDRTESNIATDVATLASRIGAPKAVEETAFYWAMKLLKAMRTKGRKMPTQEIAAVTLWAACKLQGFPITMDEFERALRGRGNGRSLLKLINKAEGIMPLPKAVVDPKRHIARLAAKLYGVADHKYVSAIEAYAKMLCDASADDISGKDPVCVASTALCVADELVGGLIGKERIVRLTGVGHSQGAAEAMKRNRPKPPEPLWDALLSSYARRVADAASQSLTAVAAMSATHIKMNGKGGESG